MLNRFRNIYGCAKAKTIKRDPHCQGRDMVAYLDDVVEMPEVVQRLDLELDLPCSGVLPLNDHWTTPCR